MVPAATVTNKEVSFQEFFKSWQSGECGKLMDADITAEVVNKKQKENVSRDEEEEGNNVDT